MNDADLTTISAQLARLRELLGGAPAFGPPWDEDDLLAFEAAHGCALPPGYRRFLAEVGDGGSVGAHVLWPLRARDPADLAWLGAPFPLTRGWVTPEITAELQGEGLGEQYAPYLYDLPEGTSVDDGSLVIGATPDHLVLRLVVTGAAAGTLWTDNRGNDFEEVLPTGERFLTWMGRLLGEQLERAEADARFDALVAAGDLAALCEATGEEALRDRFKALFKRSSKPESAAPVPPALARMIAAHHGDAYGPAGQALALGGCWDELEALSAACWARHQAGELGSAFRAEATLQAHLAVASVAAGRPCPRHVYGDGGGYWHRSSAIVPLVVARWEDSSAVGAVLERLRADVALLFLSHFPDDRLTAHLQPAREVAERILVVLGRGAYPSSERALLPSRAADLASRLSGRLVARGRSELLDEALASWLWLAGCTVSAKKYAELLAPLDGHFEAPYPTREDALAALQAAGASASDQGA